MQITKDEEKFTFLVDWKDETAGLIRSYLLTFFAVDGSLELYDIKNKRTFLKRNITGEFSLEDFTIGLKFTICSREMTVREYGDSKTKMKMEIKKQRCCAVIKPDAFDSAGYIIERIQKEGLIIAQMRTFRFDEEKLTQFFGSLQDHPQFNNLIKSLCNDLLIGMDITGDMCIRRMWLLCGDETPEEAQKNEPESIRAKLGSNWVDNAMYISLDETDAQKDLLFLFQNPHPPTSILSNCTLGLILPHIIKEGKLGQLLAHIQFEGFDISAVEQFYLDKGGSNEFLAVYHEVIRGYNTKVEELCSGPCVAMEIRGENVQKEFRDLCGPYDPSIAKQLFPKSIRAIFGESIIKNAIHCTDLPEDGVLEVM
ncbi:MAG: nucleoside-diphosphate kinase [Streblomastix strix]|uniref:Nucleoside-diphosphate kinase n=1 Tax=Streblomastix strix TaxID=222440 RepID=A0A5J4WRX4_9EUKA|nr:MAG: nucleoside-diphosphate kinase [Streblomastix strix]